MRNRKLYRHEKIGPPKEESESAEIWIGMHVPTVLGHQDGNNLKWKRRSATDEKRINFQRDDIFRSVSILKSDCECRQGKPEGSSANIKGKGTIMRTAMAHVQCMDRLRSH